jgi:hypothetical protein
MMVGDYLKIKKSGCVVFLSLSHYSPLKNVVPLDSILAQAAC